MSQFNNEEKYMGPDLKSALARMPGTVRREAVLSYGWDGRDRRQFATSVVL